LAGFAVSSKSVKRIYIGEHQAIRTNPEILVPDVSDLISLQLDRSTKRVYWMTNTFIFRRDLDGSKIRVIARLGPMATLGKDDMIIVPGETEPTTARPSRRDR
jgi:hypothetical protein